MESIFKTDSSEETMQCFLLCVTFLQVVFHAFDKFKITSFLIEANNDFRHYFTYTEGSNNCDGEVKLYTIDDVYNQIQLIVEKVSYS